MAPCKDLVKFSKSINPKTPDGCGLCLEKGDLWVHLRLCLVCGNVGCCDNSKNKHARKHAKLKNHPVVRSFEKGETWRYCFTHDQGVEN